MKLIRAIILYVLLGALVQVSAYANSATITMIAIGEDSDKSSVKRSSEIYKRVVTELQQSLMENNIYVVDEDMISSRLGFNYSENRNKQDLIKTLSIANSTNDARVRSRFALVFSVFPNIQVMSMTKKVTVRIRAQLFDLRNQRALNSFEVKSQKPLSIPKDPSICNELCLDEKIGDISIGLSEQLGNSIIDKFHVVLEKESQIENLQSNTKPKEILKNTYTIGFKNISKEKIKKAIDLLLEKNTDIEIEMLKADQSERIYSLRARKSLIETESLVLNALKETGINERRVIVQAQD